MLSSKRRFGTLPIIAVIGLGLAVSGCQVRPLYSDAPTASGQSLSSELASIEIEQAKDRVEQEIRNHLIFGFNGGANPGAPVYRLEMLVNNSKADLAIESGTGLAKTTRVTLRVNYKLINIADKSTVTTGTSFITATYAKSVQRFANDRALRDAENRAAEQVANDIQLRLSAFFAAGT